jgi:hypothetical protein
MLIAIVSAVDMHPTMLRRDEDFGSDDGEQFFRCPGDDTPFC